MDQAAEAVKDTDALAKETVTAAAEEVEQAFTTEKRMALNASKRLNQPCIIPLERYQNLWKNHISSNPSTILICRPNRAKQPWPVSFHCLYRNFHAILKSTIF